MPIHRKHIIGDPLDGCVKGSEKTRFAIIEKLIERTTRNTSTLANLPHTRTLQTLLSYKLNNSQQQPTTLHPTHMRTLTTQTTPNHNTTMRDIRRW
jgi:hypothetical protein